MPTPMVSRSTEEVESRLVDDFLVTAADGPSALLIEGEAGIGKTTLWLSAIERGRASGFQVMLARAVAAESVMAYASLADLLDEVDPSAWVHLPDVQRLAVD